MVYTEVTIPANSTNTLTVYWDSIEGKNVLSLTPFCNNGAITCSIRNIGGGNATINAYNSLDTSQTVEVYCFILMGKVK